MNLNLVMKKFCCPLHLLDKHHLRLIDLFRRLFVLICSGVLICSMSELPRPRVRKSLTVRFIIFNKSSLTWPSISNSFWFRERHYHNKILLKQIQLVDAQAFKHRLGVIGNQKSHDESTKADCKSRWFCAAHGGPLSSQNPFTQSLV